MTNERDSLRTLEDRLAGILWNIGGKGFHDIRPWGQLGADLSTRYLAMAKECLRQMEWTAQRDYSKAPIAEDGSVSLTLAPNGWTP